jgi:VacB/RNase II family 3'-5' exoribonuclease
MNPKKERHRAILEDVARRAMIDQGLLPDFSSEVLAELNLIQCGSPDEEKRRDLRHLLWVSIDQADSRDLDQVTAAKALSDGTVMILVAIADVDALVRKGSALDDHARQNTTSVYTSVNTFPLFPEGFSIDLASLNYGQDRAAIVIEMVIQEDGSLKRWAIYRALVRNHAKLSYNSISTWLEGRAPIPEPVAAVEGLSESIHLQDRAAQELRKFRHECGAVDLEPFEACPVLYDDISNLEMEQKNRAREIVEDFMITANSVTAKFLETEGYPLLRRVVRTPRRWSQIVELAGNFGFQLPPDPDSKSLNRFLVRQRATDPFHFPNLCLTIVKLMGPSEYVVISPGERHSAYFGLAVKDYTHSTCPNRRFADLVTQRILKAALSGRPTPYAQEELRELAAHCTKKENDANKVERRVAKAVMALSLNPKIGEQFDGIVTGASAKGTWVCTFGPSVEGRLISGYEGVDVGQRVRVQLIRADVEKGYIDFKRVDPRPID